MLASRTKAYLLAMTSIALFCTVSFATSKTQEFDRLEDVGHYIKSRELCDHYRNEAGDMSDVLRKKEIDEGIKNCEGTDARLASLKYRYAKSPKVMEKLRQYDILIEGNQRGLPEDVWSYLTARIQCDELLAGRARESSSMDSTSNMSLRDSACYQASDRLLGSLKSKYSKNRVVKKALSEFMPLKSRSRIQHR